MQARRPRSGRRFFVTKIVLLFSKKLLSIHYSLNPKIYCLNFRERLRIF
ncbi:MAG: hypothetical protein LBP59_17240 [Planctomycetaceae bacterium]|nr:hypothetical protein [Planctomycetaceae bacterium]